MNKKTKLKKIIKYYHKNWLHRLKKSAKNIPPQYRISQDFHFGMSKNKKADPLKLDDAKAKERHTAFVAKKVIGSRVKKMIVMDAGCGVGGTANFLVKKYSNIEVYAVNLDPEQIRYARNNLKSPRIHWVASDYSATSLPSSFFDVIYGVESICHEPNKGNFYRETSRLLKPGGRLVIFDHFLMRSESRLTPRLRKYLVNFERGWHVRAFRFPSDIKLLKRHGFKFIKFSDISSYMFPSINRSGILAKKKLEEKYLDVEKTHLKACVGLWELTKAGLFVYHYLVAKKQKQILEFITEQTNKLENVRMLCIN